MVAWSSVFIPDGSSLSSDGSDKQTTKGAFTLEETLRCYVCEEYFTKPRVLPCGHSYCSSCILQLRENALAEFNKSRDQNAHRRGECGFFTCPWPNCHYSMRIMNVYRWTLRNKALATAVAAAKKRESERETVSLQTDVDWSQTIVSISSAVMNPLGKRHRRHVPTKTTPEVLFQHLIQNTVSVDSISDSKHCRLPWNKNGGKTSWASYVFLFGMTIVDQSLKP
ncbi:RAD18-like protein [Mya arenaria]|uniref:RAD18-like protein n=1 Tax=Mya arenaria TaxID=6604 RepID=A0ABY7FJ30_MYAAR|nr:uncharacterized protein LOC128211406 [Mya arenaria]WAR20884.1 RAD18-like protein [Mya arenaria]